MKTAIIEMLEYPRSLIRDNMDLEDCEHSGQFAPADPECRVCQFKLECRWLFHNDEFVALQEKSIAEVTRALSFAVSYVDAEIARWDHRRANCRCAACAWLRRAERLHDEAARDAGLF